MSEQNENDGWEVFDLYVDTTSNPFRSEEARQKYAQHLHHKLDQDMDARLKRKNALPIVSVKADRYLDS